VRPSCRTSPFGVSPPSFFFEFSFLFRNRFSAQIPSFNDRSRRRIAEALFFAFPRFAPSTSYPLTVLALTCSEFSCPGVSRNRASTSPFRLEASTNCALVPLLAIFDAFSPPIPNLRVSRTPCPPLVLSSFPDRT